MRQVLVGRVVWLAWREMARRPSSVLASLVAMALAVALLASLEMVAASRGAVLAREVDRVGPSLSVLPEGVADLARLELGDATLPGPMVNSILALLRKELRAAEVRLARVEAVEGARAFVLGVEPGDSLLEALPGRSLPGGQVALGPILAAELGKGAGDQIPYRGRDLRVAVVLPEAGTREDLALVLPLEDLRTILGAPGRGNVIRLFLAAGVDAEAVGNRLRQRYAELTVIRADRGNVASVEIPETLGRLGRALAPIVIPTTLLALGLAAFLNVRERRGELAAFWILGMGRAERAILVAFRWMFLGAAGGLAGYLLALAVVLALPAGEVGPRGTFSPGLPVACMAGAMSVALLASVVPCLLGAARDPIAGVEE